MGTRYVVVGNQNIAIMLTTRIIVINTGAGQIIRAASGATQMVAFNASPLNLSWGDSSVLSDSGNVLYPSASWIFENIGDSFGVYWRALSNATVTSGALVLNEFSN